MKDIKNETETILKNNLTRTLKQRDDLNKRLELE